MLKAGFDSRPGRATTSSRPAQWATIARWLQQQQGAVASGGGAAPHTQTDGQDNVRASPEADGRVDASSTRDTDAGTDRQASLQYDVRALSRPLGVNWFERPLSSSNKSPFHVPAMYEFH